MISLFTESSVAFQHITTSEGIRSCGGRRSRRISANPIGQAEHLQLLGALRVDGHQSAIFLNQTPKLLLQTSDLHGNLLILHQVCQQLSFAVFQDRYFMFDLMKLFGHSAVLSVHLDALPQRDTRGHWLQPSFKIREIVGEAIVIFYICCLAEAEGDSNFRFIRRHSSS